MGIAVVAGGAGGIGQVLVDALIADGNSVAIWDVNEEQINKILNRYNNVKEKVLGVKCDIVNYDGVLHALKLTHERLGKPIKILVNAAGLFHFSNFLEIDAYKFKQIIEVNLIGPANTIRAVLPDMINSGGVIVNITSRWASRIGINISAYIASKCGLLALTKALSEEFKKHGIRFIAVSPGPVVTPMTLPYIKEGKPPKDWLRPEDVARVIMSIIKDDSFGGGEEIQIFGKGSLIGT